MNFEEWFKDIYTVEYNDNSFNEQRMKRAWQAAIESKQAEFELAEKEIVRRREHCNALMKEIEELKAKIQGFRDSLEWLETCAKNNDMKAITDFFGITEYNYN